GGGGGWGGGGGVGGGGGGGGGGGQDAVQGEGVFGHGVDQVRGAGPRRGDRWGDHLGAVVRGRAETADQARLRPAERGTDRGLVVPVGIAVRAVRAGRRGRSRGGGPRPGRGQRRGRPRAPRRLPRPGPDQHR